MCDAMVREDPCTLWLIPDHLKTQEMCDKAVRTEPFLFHSILDCFKTQEMCNEIMRKNPAALYRIPDHLKTQEMCDEVVEVDPWLLKYVPDHFKTQKMCDKVVRDGAPIFLEHPPNWFITKQQLKIMGDHCNNNWFNERYEGYQKRRAQKAKIKEELMPIA